MITHIDAPKQQQHIIRIIKLAMVACMKWLTDMYMFILFCILNISNLN